MIDTDSVAGTVSSPDNAYVSGGSPGLSLEFSMGEGSQERRTVVNKAYFAGQELRLNTRKTLPPILGAILGAHHVNHREDADRWSKIRRRKSGEYLISALRHLEPELQGLEVITGAAGPLFRVDVGLERLLPISAVGDGLTHLCKVLLAIGWARRGLDLIDEFENGYHHKIMEKVWTSIRAAAMSFDVQVVVTTHGRECIVAAHHACAPENLLVHRLERRGDASRCVTYPSEATRGAITHNFGIR